MTVDSSELNTTLPGFGGPVDVRVSFDDGGIVTNVAPVLPNDETPMFFEKLDEGFWGSWNGLTAEQAAKAEVDAVTGATYSSEAAIESVRAAAAAYRGVAQDGAEPAAHASFTVRADAAASLALLVVLAVVPLWTRARGIRPLLLALSVAVLGFWQGLFLSMARLKGWFSSGLHGGAIDIASAVILLATAFIYPFFGRPGHYCANVCPFGASQELAGLAIRRKPAIPPRLAAALDRFRLILFIVLMALMLAGMGDLWLGGEAFAAFAFRAAPPVAVALAVASLVLSVFITRPYCRFVCPTGTLLKIAQQGLSRPAHKTVNNKQGENNHA